MSLDHALQYGGRGWSVFPLSASKKPFKGSHGFLDASTDPQRINELWKGRVGANIGLATGRIVVIDPDGPTALERLKAIGQAHGGWPQTLTVKTPRGIHLYYLAPPGIEIRSYNEPRHSKGTDGIDIKGSGGYVVLPPSKLKKEGQTFEYKWLLQLPLAILPDWAVDWINSLKGVQKQAGNGLFTSTMLPSYIAARNQNNLSNQASITKRASASLGEPWSQFVEDRIWAALSAIPATGYDRWLQVGMALSTLDWDRPDGTSTAFELFDDWSATAPEVYSQVETEKKWASFGRSGRAGITLGTLYHLAEQHGWLGLAPPEIIEQKPPANGRGLGVMNASYVADATSAGWHDRPPFLSDDSITIEPVNGYVIPLPDELSSPVDPSPLITLNHKYCCIGDVGGKCLVMGWVPSKADPAVEVPSFQTFKSFGERYGNRYIKVSKQTKAGTEQQSAQLGPYWLKWRQRVSYDGIDLVPNAPHVLPNNNLNLWRGFSIMERQGAWPLMQQHIAYVLADGDVAALDYIMRWSTWAVQNPGERAEAALVFRGGKGSGKGTFAHALRRIFGMHGLHIANSKHLVGSFNAHLRNCLLLYADEAFWAGDKQGESTLKALITEATLTIEQKGVDAMQWHNRIHLIMTANADWVVPASHDERRYAMFNVSEQRINDQAYFNALHHELNNGGLEAMLYDLKRVPLGDWHPRHVLKTKALTEQKMQSMPPLLEWWEAMLQEGSVPAAPKDSPDCAMAVYLLNHAREFAPKLRELTPTRLGRFLSDHGAIKIHRGTGNAWRLPTLQQARETWTKRYQGWKWERDNREWEAKMQ